MLIISSNEGRHDETEMVLATVIPAASARGVFAEAPVKILFVGNSQLFMYDLPRLFKLLAETTHLDSPRIETGQALVGGASLKSHWEAGAKPGSARALMATSHWDYVVLQENCCASELEFTKYAEMFDELIRKHEAQTILFAAANATQYYAASFKYPDSFEQLNGMQLAFGKNRGIAVAAAGYAWMKYLGPHPSESQILDLYAQDKGHPGKKGTYIYACLLYAMITGKNPAGLTSEFKDIQGGIIIRQDEAAKMQQAAWEQYLETSKQ